MIEMLMDVIAMLRILAQDTEEEDSLLWPGWPDAAPTENRTEG